MSLPKFVVLKSTNNDKYLRYRHESGSIHGFIQCSGDEAWSPYAKFEVVKASHSGKIHLKCCYNNKYLTYWNKYHNWIVAGADKPDEGDDKITTTLFEPTFEYNLETVQFQHKGGYMCRGCRGEFTNCVYVGGYTDQTTSVFTYVDWETIVPPKPKNCNVKIGAWGGGEGDDWIFQAEGEGGITGIIIYSEDVVDAVSFVTQTADGPIESPRFGGDGGTKHEIGLNWPKVYLMSIRGTYDTLDSDSQVITSLEFKTNEGKRIGPFGKRKGTSFTLKMDGGAIVGFHGCSSDSSIAAIGIFTRHVDDKEH